MIGVGIGLTNGGRRASAAKRLGATWVLGPLTLSGSLITAAADVAGGAVTLTASSGKEPTVDIGDATQYAIDKTKGPFTGKKSIRMTAQGTRLWNTTAGVVGSGAACAFWWTGIVEYPTGVCPAPGFGTFVLLGTSAAANNVGFGSASTTYFAIMGDGALTFATRTLDTELHRVEVKYDGSTWSVTIDGRAYTIGSITTTVSDASFGFQSEHTAYPPQNSRIHSWAHKVGAPPAQALINAFMRAECARLTVSGAGPRMVAFFGDSYTQGSTSGAEPIETSVRTVTVAPRLILPENYGVSGEKASDIATRLLAYTGAANDIVIWAGRNGPATVTPAADAATSYVSITAMVAKAHALGSKAIVCTIPQWSSDVGGTYSDQYRVALNTLINANAAGADAIALVSEAFGAYNAANFCADTLHPNIAALRAYAAPAINTARLAA